MASRLAALSSPRSSWFDLGVFVVGMIMLGTAMLDVVQNSLALHLPYLLAIPIAAIVARFPMVLDRGEGGIEVGFDSGVLFFLLCALSVEDRMPSAALVVWSLGVLLTQLPSDKRLLAKLFNVGLGIIGGVVAGLLLSKIQGSREIDQPLVLVGVAVAAVGYFATDYVLSAISVSLETGSPLSRHLVQRGALLAIAYFVPFDTLGYLGALLVRDVGPWALVLLAVPLATLLIATRAVTRGGENSRRLTVLFDAAVRAQTLSDPRQVVDALVDDARKLLRITQVEVRATPPGAHEIGARLRDGHRDRWIVAPGRSRARSTMSADQQALEAMVAVSSDAFSRLRLTEEMTHLARHDLLTDLPNRGLLLDRVEHALQVSRRRDTPIALLFIDLDGFKPVNDRFGHAAGDAVLVDVAQRLRACVRESDTVARLGGDEFAVLLEDVQLSEVSTACDRILGSLGRGAHVAGHQLSLSASIGVAFGDRTETAESMLRNADLAMYEAKARGKSQYVEYERAIGSSRLQRLELVESLHASVSRGDITVVYQPIVRASTGRITGVEALARWSSNGVEVSPDVFIRVAEETGLVVSLGDLVLGHAARDSAAIKQAAGGDVNVSVNISAKQLREPDFVSKVERVLDSFDDGCLILEITERDGVGDDPATLETMRALAERGVPFAIDDFGVGFSSIGYLQDMPVQIIKTDLSFSEGIDRDERSCALLCSITMMGQALGLDVVVEGIERPSQLEHLREHVHAPYAQGYLMHRPMLLDQLLRVLAVNRSVSHPEPLPSVSAPPTLA